MSQSRVSGKMIRLVSLRMKWFIVHCPTLIDKWWATWLGTCYRKGQRFESQAFRSLWWGITIHCRSACYRFRLIEILHGSVPLHFSRPWLLISPPVWWSVPLRCIHTWSVTKNNWKSWKIMYSILRLRQVGLELECFLVTIIPDMLSLDRVNRFVLFNKTWYDIILSWISIDVNLPSMLWWILPTVPRNVFQT